MSDEDRMDALLRQMAAEGCANPGIGNREQGIGRPGAKGATDPLIPGVLHMAYSAR